MRYTASRYEGVGTGVPDGPYCRILRQPNLASPLGERWHAKRDGEGCSYSSPTSRHGRQIAAPTVATNSARSQREPPRPPCKGGWRLRRLGDFNPSTASRRSPSLFKGGICSPQKIAQSHGRKIAAPTESQVTQKKTDSRVGLFASVTNKRSCRWRCFRRRRRQRGKRAIRPQWWGHRRYRFRSYR